MTAIPEGLQPLPKPAVWAVREGIGETLHYFSETSKEAESAVGYKDSVEGLYTAEQMAAYANAAVAASQQANAGLVANDRRYRWLRDGAKYYVSGIAPSLPEGLYAAINAPSLDAEIDAAIASQDVRDA